MMSSIFDIISEEFKGILTNKMEWKFSHELIDRHFGYFSQGETSVCIYRKFIRDMLSVNSITLTNLGTENHQPLSLSLPFPTIAVLHEQGTSSK